MWRVLAGMHSGGLLDIIRSAARRSIPPLCIAVAVSAGESVCAVLLRVDLPDGPEETPCCCAMTSLAFVHRNKGECAFLQEWLLASASALISHTLSSRRSVAMENLFRAVSVLFDQPLIRQPQRLLLYAAGTWQDQAEAL